MSNENGDTGNSEYTRPAMLATLETYSATQGHVHSIPDRAIFPLQALCSLLSQLPSLSREKYISTNQGLF